MQTTNHFVSQKRLEFFPYFFRDKRIVAIFLETFGTTWRTRIFQRQSYERGFFVDVLSQNIKLGPYDFSVGSYIQDRFLRCDSFPNTVEILRKST